MALEKADNVVFSRPRRRPKVLDEEAYTENLERIITRDFFPDHGKLRDHKEYLEAEEKKDFEKMRQIALKYARRQNNTPATGTSETPTPLPFPSPATFETPVLEGQCPPSVKMKHTVDELDVDARSEAKNLGYEKKNSDPKEDGQIKTSDVDDGLNSFLSKYTSEDNESFETILEKSEEAKREKHSWMYEAEIVHAGKNREMMMLEHETKQKLLAIEDRKDMAVTKKDNDPGLDEQAEKTTSKPLQLSDGDRQSRTVDTWTYKAKNHLMYYPEGVPDDDTLFKKPYEITLANTRFQKDPFKDALDRSKLVEAAAENARFSVGERVGHDGKAILPQASPNVNGFGFVATPSPSPGVDMSPIMTWGVVEGTPARLDGSNTPTPGPSFRFPKESRRDELTHKMVDENTKKNRAKKQAALRQVKESVLAGTPRRVGSIMSSERINTLSPAARRLVNKKIGLGSDKRLKQSYTPTPHSGTLRGDLTPISKTPTPGSRSRQTPQGSSGYSSPSITDNLLNIPTKKKRAADFF